MDKTSKTEAIQAFRESLKKNNLKVTPQRLAVHEAMLELGHACADMVTERLAKESNVKVTVASVYNILSQMAMLGIYQHRMSSNNKMYFDVNTFKHIHLYNTVDHTFMDVMDDDLYKMIESRLTSRRFKGFKIDGIDIQIIVHPTSRRKSQ